LAEPLERLKPAIYFVNSMSDLFHAKVSFSYIERVFDV
jgi:protein gp37